jgi:hypothetical protein
MEVELQASGVEQLLQTETTDEETGRVMVHPPGQLVMVKVVAEVTL